ncbi:unnamed protein product [Rotaria socialis]|uniref:Peptidase S1 domain-containing protein n=1 Tax=Rotaria socialis TaxID=392032 RepID=A0A818EFP9_9BILA|nr:unnamed protein product [Rotaria socialis]CAF3505523.1 unnamed protein product [Rotaria socialis]
MCPQLQKQFHGRSAPLKQFTFILNTILLRILMIWPCYVSVPPSYSTRIVQLACLPGGEPKPDDQYTQTSLHTKVVGECDQWWQPLYNSKQICVADSITGASACKGDSGGPILALY